MAEMKRFAIWLAKQVYGIRASDEDIKRAALSTWGIEDGDWLQSQIKFVRESPELFRELANA